MKKIKFTILLFIATVSGFSQKITLSFKDLEKQAIPYLTIVDSIHNVFQATNDSGITYLKSSNYIISTSHISFIDTTFDIYSPLKDTSYLIYLKNKSENLNEVLIQSNKFLNNKKKYEIGNYSKKTLYKDQLYSNLKLGFWANPSLSLEIKHFLRSIKFRISNFKSLRKESFVIEIKLFKVFNKTIEPVAANKKPIFLQSKDLKKYNEVNLEEILTFPADGFFISFELPPVLGGNSNRTVEFVTDYSSKCCKLFVKNNTKPWSKDLLTQSCPTNEDNGGFKELMLSLTYYNSK